MAPAARNVESRMASFVDFMKKDLLNIRDIRTAGRYGLPGG
jgi:uncharacterized protein YggE